MCFFSFLSFKSYIFFVTLTQNIRGGGGMITFVASALKKNVLHTNYYSVIFIVQIFIFLSTIK